MMNLSSMLAAFFLVGAAHAALAETIIDTLPSPPNSGYNYVIAGPPPFSGTPLAAGFVSPGSFELTQITLDLFSDPQVASAVRVEILSDENGLPGPLVGSGFIMPVAPLGPNLNSVAVSGIELDEGMRYWLAVFPSSGHVVTWSGNPAYSALIASSIDHGATWQHPGFTTGQAAFKLDGTATPELPTSVLLSTAILVAAGGRRTPLRVLGLRSSMSGNPSNSPVSNV
jgi:hypothetical protein